MKIKHDVADLPEKKRIRASRHKKTLCAWGAICVRQSFSPSILESEGQTTDAGVVADSGCAAPAPFYAQWSERISVRSLSSKTAGAC